VANIYIYDSWRKFWDGGAEYWRAAGHDVEKGIYWGPDLSAWADIEIFHPVENNLIQASKKQRRRKGQRVVAEAIDIDIYAGHPGAVRWNYVTDLVFMSRHMLEYTFDRYADKIPEALPKHVVPGGVDMGAFTLRKAAQRGYNIAWVGRLWIAKNVFGALQIFNQLVQFDPGHPWRLFIRGEKYHPPHWWKRHCESYIEVNPHLRGRVIFTDRADDMNDWYEDKGWLLQTSFKEAFGYVIAEALAKGVQPVIGMTTGALDIWPREWVYQTHADACRMFLSGGEDANDLRAWVKANYSLKKRMEAWDAVLGL
jgi:glycosyltransferase involved in cell wall biosynthesis